MIHMSVIDSMNHDQMMVMNYLAGVAYAGDENVAEHPTLFDKDEVISNDKAVTIGDVINTMTSRQLNTMKEVLKEVYKKGLRDRQLMEGGTNSIDIQEDKKLDK